MKLHHRRDFCSFLQRPGNWWNVLGVCQGGRVQMLPPLPGAWWWLEITEIAETDLGLGIWVHHDVKSTNKIYSFKQKKLSVRNKEQKMSLFVSLHTFVEKPVRCELQTEWVVCIDDNFRMFQPQVPAAWPAPQPRVPPHNLRQKTEALHGIRRPSLPGLQE